MRRVLIAALTAALFLGITAAGLPEGTAVPRLVHLNTDQSRDATRDPDWRWEQCRFRNLEGGPSFSDREMRLILVCAEQRFPVQPGGMDTVMAIVGCEGGLNEHADNPSSSAAGPWQIIASTWESWKRQYAELRHRWGLHPSAYNGRANAVLGVRKAHVSLAPWDWSRHCWG